MTATLVRCHPDSPTSLCPDCIALLPVDQAEMLARTYWDGDLFGHAQAASNALDWLREHRRTRYITSVTAAAGRAAQAGRTTFRETP